MKKTGFTLIEMLVSVAIFSIMVLAVFAVLEIGKSAWFTGDASVELRQELIRAVTKIEKELKETRPSQINLTIGSTSNTLTFKVPQDINGDGTILDAMGNIEWSGDITYVLNGANQITRTALGVTSVIARDITSLQFSRPVTEVSILQVNISAQKKSILGRVVQDSAQVSIKMRN